MPRRYEDTYHMNSDLPGSHSYLSTDHIVPSYRENIVSPWLKHLPNTKDGYKLLLDLASGTGEFARKVQNDGVQVVSTDISEAGLRNTADPKRARASFLELPFLDAAFSGVHFKDALVHVPDLQPLFQEINRVLQPEGQALVVGREHGSTGWMDLGDNRYAYYYRWNAGSIVRAAKQSGFALLKQSTWIERAGEHDWYTSAQKRDVFIFRKK